MPIFFLPGGTFIRVTPRLLRDACLTDFLRKLKEGVTRLWQQRENRFR
jgi:hypothetical protein